MLVNLIWKRALRFENIDHLKVYYVYIKNFRDEDMEFLHKLPNGDGTFIETPLGKLKLKDHSSLTTSRLSILLITTSSIN